MSAPLTPEELAKLVNPRLWERLKKSYGPNPVDAMSTPENKKCRTLWGRLVDSLKPIEKIFSQQTAAKDKKIADLTNQVITLELELKEWRDRS